MTQTRATSPTRSEGRCGVRKTGSTAPACRPSNSDSKDVGNLPPPSFLIGERAPRRGCSGPPAPLGLPLDPGHAHQHLLVPDRDPAREHLHRVLEVGVEEDLAGAVDQGRGDGVEDVEAAGEGGGGGGQGGKGGVRVAEEHEDVPDAELGGEGDGVVEEGEVPAGAVGGGGDVVLVLLRARRSAHAGMGRISVDGAQLTNFAATSPFPSQSFSNS